MKLFAFVFYISIAAAAVRVFCLTLPPGVDQWAQGACAITAFYYALHEMCFWWREMRAAGPDTR